MRLQSSVVVIVLVLFLLPSLSNCCAESPEVETGIYTTSTLSPERQLISAYRIAKNGNVERGLSLAKDTIKACPDDLSAKLNFIDTMVRIQKLGPTEHKTQLLNCAIKTANDIFKTDQCQGDQDPALGFKYMRSLRGLAGVVYTERRKVSIQLKAVAGDIAENLYTNKRVSEKSHKYLAKPLYEKARIHQYNQERELAAEALKVSFQVGFTEIAKAKRDFSFEFLAATDVIRTTIESAVDSMVANEIKEARTAFRDFNSIPLVIDVQDLKRGRMTNADFAGKPIVVDLWATWCPPCRKAIPHFIKLRNEYDETKLGVAAISLDDMDNPLGARGKVKAAVEKYKFNYPCGLGDYGIVNQIGGELKLPTTLFIDAKGNLRYVAQGYMDYVKLNALTKALLELDD